MNAPTMWMVRGDSGRLYGEFRDRGLYVSTGGFSKDARYEGDRAGIPVTLWELDDIVRYLVDYCDKVDNETRQMVPLKRIYWPA